jgi:hypothetical protein
MTKGIFALLLVSVCAFYSCSEYRQLYTLSTGSGISRNDSVYYFENDTLKIVYSFWKERGILGYEVYNKLSIPIYIDWKKCSFVVNNVKMNYWADETISTGTSVRNSYSSTSAGYFGLLGISGSVSVIQGKSIKPERITFLAPHSGIVRADFKLWSGAITKFSSAERSGTLQKPGYGQVLIRYRDYNMAESPLTFRNFLTYSTTESFSREIYVDNEFYISRISQMKVRDFEGRPYYDKIRHEQLLSQPFNTPTMFYLGVK